MLHERRLGESWELGFWGWGETRSSWAQRKQGRKEEGARKGDRALGGGERRKRTNDDGKERREAVGADAGLCDTSTHGAGVAGGAEEWPLHSGLPWRLRQCNEVTPSLHPPPPPPPSSSSSSFLLYLVDMGLLGFWQCDHKGCNDRGCRGDAASPPLLLLLIFICFWKAKSSSKFWGVLRSFRNLSLVMRNLPFSKREISEASVAAEHHHRLWETDTHKRAEERKWTSFTKLFLQKLCVNDLAGILN